MLLFSCIVMVAQCDAPRSAESAVGAAADATPAARVLTVTAIPAATPAKELFTPALTAAEKAAQEEFGFGEIESRGHFEKTDRNLFDGQDLDVPTYLRKGIKISL